MRGLWTIPTTPRQPDNAILHNPTGVPDTLDVAEDQQHLYKTLFIVCGCWNQPNSAGYSKVHFTVPV